MSNNHDKELKDIISILQNTYRGKIYSKTSMETVSEVNKSGTDSIEKLKLIGEKISEFDEEFCQLIPVSEGSDGQEYEVSVEELRYVIAEAVCPYLEKTEVRYGYSSKQDKELFTMRRINKLSQYVYELANRVFYYRSGNRMSVMKPLLDIANAIMEKLSEYWQEYKYEVEQVAHNIPIYEVLDKVHKAGYTDFDKAIETMLPEVVASFFFHYRECDTFVYELKLISEDEDCDYLISETTCNEIFKSLMRGNLYDVNRPLNEQLCEIEESIVYKSWDADMRRMEEDYYGF